MANGNGTDPRAAPERILHHRPPDILGAVVMQVENCGRCWRVYHETYTIATVIGGTPTVEATWRYRGRQEDMGPGVVAFMEPGEVHANTRVKGLGTFRVMHLDVETVRRHALDLGLPTATPHFSSMQTSRRDVFAAMVRFHRSLERSATPLERQTLFADALRRLLGDFTESRPQSVAEPDSTAAVSRAREMLHERFDEPVSLDELAREAGMSPYHLVRVFAKHTGLPPHAYQVCMRVERARRLLEFGEPATRVAFETGFADQSHMTRHFRRLVGVPPAAYQRQICRRARTF